MADLVIDTVDSVNIKIDCERGLAKELSDFFTFDVPGSIYVLLAETRCGTVRSSCTMYTPNESTQDLRTMFFSLHGRGSTVSRASDRTCSPSGPREDVRAWACDHLLTQADPLSHHTITRSMLLLMQ